VASAQEAELGRKASGGAKPEPPAGLERVIRRRGSTREFAPNPVPRAELARVLAYAAGPIPADFAPAAEAYAIVNAINGLAPGSYRFEPPDRFALLRGGRFRLQAGYLALEQPLAALAAATVFLMADLDDALGRLGNRGHRT